MRELPTSGGVRPPGDRPAAPDEADLLDRVREGDPEAFDAIAREHAPRLYRLARHLAGRDDAAEDLVQETLVRSLPRLARFEGRARLSTYLMRALTNLWRNRTRSERRSRLVPWPRASAEEDASEVEFPDREPDALERLVRRDRDSRVREALGTLEPVRRLTILLREVEGLSYEEIAEMTEVPVGTVRSRLARARADLRAALGGST